MKCKQKKIKNTENNIQDLWSISQFVTHVNRQAEQAKENETEEICEIKIAVRTFQN